ncbi:MAG: tellurite resistance TerB family protein [Thioalkalivibrionaceae bacterium]
MNANQILQQLMRQVGQSGTNPLGGQDGGQGGLDGLLGNVLGQGAGGMRDGDRRGGVQGLSGVLGNLMGGQASPSDDVHRSARVQDSSSALGGLDMKSLLGGGAAGTALGLLLGSKGGRRVGGSALKIGAIAGVGGLAWRAWQKRGGAQPGMSGAVPGEPRLGSLSSVQSTGGAPADRPIEQLAPPQREQRSLELLHAMIFAARADGHISAVEQGLLEQQIDALGADQDLHDWVAARMQEPLDAVALARAADSAQAAREMYLVSVAVANGEHPMARAWLAQLAQALHLDAETVAAIEAEVAAVA